MIIYLTKSVFKGKTLVRSMMNKALSDYTLTGDVLDIGGGRKPSYLRFLNKANNFKLSTVDIATGEDNLKLDLERDALPYHDQSHDEVLMINFLEHIYNHKHIVRESFRVLKKGGRLVGFVPFMVNVHPDPHDYYRYTNESLVKLFKGEGFTVDKIEPIGYGPFAVVFNTFVSFIPGTFLAWALPLLLGLDKLLLLWEPSLSKRFPLGYLFIMRK